MFQGETNSQAFYVRAFESLQIPKFTPETPQWHNSTEEITKLDLRFISSSANDVIGPRNKRELPSLMREQEPGHAKTVQHLTEPPFYVQCRHHMQWAIFIRLVPGRHPTQFTQANTWRALYSTGRNLTYLSPWNSSCRLRPSNDTHDVFLLSGDTEI